MKQFDAPIPGQSLTNEPRNYPWERPPETTDPDEAIVHHLTRIGDPKMLDSILDVVKQGMPVALITEMMLTGAVAKGIHSIDISMIVAPVIHDYIVNILEEENVEFDEFFPQDDEEDTLRNLAAYEAVSGLRAESSSMPVDSAPIEGKEAPVEEEESKELEAEPMGGGRGLMTRKEVL